MGLEIILLSRQADKTFGKLGATLKDAGVGYSFQDLAIASIALTENSTIASNDRFLKTRQRFQPTFSALRATRKLFRPTSLLPMCLTARLRHRYSRLFIGCLGVSRPPFEDSNLYYVST
jgi:hypothetical protein